jgi:hypothetical protein
MPLSLEKIILSDKSPLHSQRTKVVILAFLQLVDKIAVQT